MPGSSSPTPPIASIIATVIALVAALLQQQFPPAQRHFRMVALRADQSDLADVEIYAREVENALDQAIRPARTIWAPLLHELHDAVERAIEAHGLSDG